GEGPRLGARRRPGHPAPDAGAGLRAVPDQPPRPRGPGPDHRPRGGPEHGGPDRGAGGGGERRAPGTDPAHRDGRRAMTLRLLVVEDDDEFRSALVRTLNQQGFDSVQEAATVEEALDSMGRSASDVVLTDLRLGERDGIDLIHSLRQSHPGAQPILMSAYATARDVQVALAQGAVTVLCKPFTSEELRAAIQQA